VRVTSLSFFFFQAEDGIRDWSVTGVQTCALPISQRAAPGDIALLTGAFLYPHLLGAFDRLLDSLGKRGFVVALDTGWPPGGWDAATRARLAGWLGRCDHILLNEIECLSLSQAVSIEDA